MIKHIRCPACGRYRKLGHENRAGTDKAYSKDCMSYKNYTLSRSNIYNNNKEAEKIGEIMSEVPGIGSTDLKETT